jgi:chlorite dismutase
MDQESLTRSALAPAGGGWHCSHLYYAFDRGELKKLPPAEVAAGGEEFIAALDPAGEYAPLRLQCFLVSGHKADFGLMMLDPDPLVIDRIHQRLMASPLGPALRPGYSFVSLTEISEYVQSPEDYGRRLVAEGLDPSGPDYATRMKAYADRMAGMNRQRLTPEFPEPAAFPAICFYPMNKKRVPGENWFLLSKEDRSRLMIEHARSGMAFGGRVSQLITVGLGFDDFEWGVTLWGSNPEYLKDIVYRMRFDEASARYAEFGTFLVGYLTSAAEILNHCFVNV